MIAYALIGTSRPLSVTTTSTIAALTAAALATTGAETTADAIQVVATLGILTGAILFVAGVLKLGFLAEFISLPVLAGFKTGTGLLIIAGQLPKALGIEASDGNFFQKTWSAIEHVPDADGRTALVAALTLALLVAVRLWAPKAFPGALLAVALGIALSSLLDLGAKGVVVVGPVPAGLPGLELPDFGLLEALLPAAAGIALMSFVESIAAGRAFVRPTDQPLDADRELLALGAASVGSGFFRGLPTGGGLSQTAVNDAAGRGGHLRCRRPHRALPDRHLRGIAAGEPGGGRDRRGGRARRPGRDSRARAYPRVGHPARSGAVSGVLLLGVLGGVLIGVIVSMLGLFARLSRPEILVVERAGGELVARIDGPVYFANAGYVHTQLLAIADAAPSRPRTLVLDLVAVSDTDVTALLRVPALERDLSVRTIGLQFENASPRLVELARRTPGLSDRC